MHEIISLFDGKYEIGRRTYKFCEKARHIRNISPCDQVKGLQFFPNLLLFIPQRDARTEARIKM